MADRAKKSGLTEVFVIEAINHVWRAGIKPGKEVSFHPDPGVFMTEAEAQFYCAKHSDKLCAMERAEVLEKLVSQHGQECVDAFVEFMQGYLYGAEETQQAFHFFKAGWDLCREKYANAAPKLTRDTMIP